MEEGRRLKEEANAAYAAANIEEALRKYEEAVSLLEKEEAEEDKVESNEAEAGTTDKKGETRKVESKQPTEREKLLAVLHANAGACLLQKEEYKRVVDETTKAIGYDSMYAKAYMRRSKANEVLSNYSAAYKDVEKTIEIEPNFPGAKEKLVALKPRADEQFEQEKGEVLGKLKDLGNSVLGKFGLSLDNFKVQQSAEGGYNVSFSK